MLSSYCILFILIIFVRDYYPCLVSPFVICCLLQLGQKDNPAVDPIIQGLKGVVHHGKWWESKPLTNSASHATVLHIACPSKFSICICLYLFVSHCFLLICHTKISSTWNNSVGIKLMWVIEKAVIPYKISLTPFWLILAVNSSRQSGRGAPPCLP